MGDKINVVTVEIEWAGSTEVCRLVVTNFATRIRACAEFQFKIPTKSEHCKFVTTNLQTSVTGAMKSDNQA